MSYSPSATPSATDFVALDPTARVRGRAPLRIPVRTGPGELVVEVAGRGPPVLLVHGWAVDRRMWSHQLAAFRRVFTTVTYDRRGAGETTAPCDYTLELQDVDTILDEIGLPKAGILGMSQGGRVALQYAMTRPHRVTGLVLQGVPLDDPPARTTGRPLAAAAGPVRRDAPPWQSRNRWSVSWNSIRSWAAGPRRALVQDEIAAMLKDYRGEDLIASLAASLAEHLPLHAADLREVRAPTAGDHGIAGAAVVPAHR